MSRPLPIIHLAPDKNVRVAFWTYMYDQGFAWCMYRHTKDTTIREIPDYITWPYVYLEAHGNLYVKYDRRVSPEPNLVFTLVNSARQFVTYARRLNVR